MTRPGKTTERWTDGKLGTSLVPCCLLLLCGCGARTPLDVSPPTPCASRPPWLVFDYYPATQGGRDGISAMRADGSSFHQLDLGVGGVFPSIAPDSASMSYVAFVSSVNDQEEAIDVFDFATGKNRELARIVVDSQNFSGLGMSAIAPDNKLVAYATENGVHLVGFDGSNDHLISSGAFGGAVYGRPVFSASSSTLYFSTFGHLASVDIDGTSRTLLVEFASLFVPNPSFSPDYSKFVAQVVCGANGSELRIYSLGDLPGDLCTAGTKLIEVGRTQAWNQSANAAWGPSNLIAYESGSDIMVIDAGGGEPRNLTANIATGPGYVASDPTWATGCAQIP